MSNFVHRLLGASAIAVLVKVAGAFLSYVMFVALARSMTVEEFGYFSFSFSVAAILAKTAVFGQQKLMLRGLARASSCEVDKIIRIRGYLSVFLFSFGISVALGLFAYLGTRPGPFGGTLLAAALFVPIMALSELQTSLLRAYQMIVLAMAPREVLWRGLVCFAGFGVCFLYGPILSGQNGLLICACLLALATLLQSVYAERARFWTLDYKWAVLKDREWASVSLQFWLSTVINFGTPVLSVIIVGLFVSTVDSGSFFAAQKSSQTINLILIGLGIVAAPLISKYYGSGDYERLQTVTAYCAGTGFFFSLIAFLFFLFFGDLLLGLFGADHMDGYSSLIIMSAGYVFNAACGTNAALLEMTKHQHRFLRIILLSNAMGIVALFPATYFYGAPGAAFVVSGTLVLWNTLASISAIRYTGVNPTIFGIFSTVTSRKKTGTS